MARFTLTGHDDCIIDTLEEDLPPDFIGDAEFLLEQIPELQNFDLIGKIGEGAFSKVYKARFKMDMSKREYALKYLIPTSHPKRIARELRCLKLVESCENVIKVETVLLNKGHTVIVMPYVQCSKFSNIVYSSSLEETQDYMKHLLIALSNVHAHDIIHRDVKPGNFLYDGRKKQFYLADFGLAEIVKEENRPIPHSVKSSSSLMAVKKERRIFEKSCFFSSTSSRKNSAFSTPTASPSFVPKTSFKRCKCFGKPYVCSFCSEKKMDKAPRAGTSGFRAPEVLMRYKHQTTAIDIWSAGIIFIALLSAKYPFFIAHDDLTSLAEICSVLGTKRVKKVATLLGKSLTMTYTSLGQDLKQLCKNLRVERFDFQGWGSELSSEESNGWTTVPDSAYELLNEMLDPNPLTRITAKEALTHPFFTNNVNADEI